MPATCPHVCWHKKQLKKVEPALDDAGYTRHHDHWNARFLLYPAVALSSHVEVLEGCFEQSFVSPKTAQLAAGCWLLAADCGPKVLQLVQKSDLALASADVGTLQTGLQTRLQAGLQTGLQTRLQTGPQTRPRGGG